MHSSQQYLFMYVATDSFSDRCDRENEQFAINGSTARSRVDSIIVDSVTEKRDEIRIHPRTESFLLFARRLFMRGTCARARSSVSLATPSACGRTRDAYREVACGRTVS